MRLILSFKRPTNQSLVTSSPTLLVHELALPRFRCADIGLDAKPSRNNLNSMSMDAVPMSVAWGSVDKQSTQSVQEQEPKP
jgi:hypothetical protein